MLHADAVACGLSAPADGECFYSKALVPAHRVIDALLMRRVIETVVREVVAVVRH